MKTFKFLSFIMLLVALPLLSGAQKQYSHVGITNETIASDTVIDLEPVITEAGYIIQNADTNITFNASTARVRPGAKIILKVTGDGTKRYIYFSDNMAAPDDSVTAETKTFLFWYDGLTFSLISKQSLSFSTDTDAIYVFNDRYRRLWFANPFNRHLNNISKQFTYNTPNMTSTVYSS